MPSPFPGMDPYLEHPALWHQIYTVLIGQLQLHLAPLVAPRYRVVVERRMYLTLMEPGELVGVPDLGVVLTRPEEPRALATTVATQVLPLIAELPQPEERRQRYLEIREVDTDRLITVVEILSPDNKRSGEGREQYERKRLEVLSTLTHLVEIDLLRAGEPMPMRILGDGHPGSSYRIVISRAEGRPRAQVYLFGIRDPIPTFPLPLRQGDEEPLVDLGQLIHEIYDRARYDLAVDYTQPPPPPPLSDEDAEWLDEHLLGASLRG